MRRGAVGLWPPKPTSQRKGPSGRSTFKSMCDRGPRGASSGAIQRTRADSGVTLKPRPVSTRQRTPFCSKQ